MLWNRETQVETQKDRVGIFVEPPLCGCSLSLGAGRAGSVCSLLPGPMTPPISNAAWERWAYLWVHMPGLKLIPMTRAPQWNKCSFCPPTQPPELSSSKEATVRNRFLPVTLYSMWNSRTLFCHQKRALKDHYWPESECGLKIRNGVKTSSLLKSPNCYFYLSENDCILMLEKCKLFTQFSFLFFKCILLQPIYFGKGIDFEEKKHGAERYG